MNAASQLADEQEQPAVGTVFVGAAGAAKIADRHVETVRQAAREGELHGTQREGVNPRTHKPFRGAKWSFRPECVIAWVECLPCPHQRAARAPVNLADFRMER
ncbi:hypothetical protein MUN78_07140 [Leucobacter allii]|uniref:DNA-binding protein n=1 Tax=Leucobacter allii TaxID=2932247 RepID=A0ABY4FQN8_9MICO|nr:hypothetical protein [Leucobacter allii]UOQ58592.1 hypothetical protein MUN78_07140 [Leucobacter allii]